MLDTRIKKICEIQLKSLVKAVTEIIRVQPHYNRYSGFIVIISIVQHWSYYIKDYYRSLET